MNQIIVAQGRRALRPEARGRCSVSRSAPTDGVVGIDNLAIARIARLAGAARRRLGAGIDLLCFSSASACGAGEPLYRIGLRASTPI